MSKGSVYRPVNQEAYDRSWERIFGKDKDEEIDKPASGQEEE